MALAGFKTLIMSGWKLPVLFIFLSPVIGMIVGITVTISTTWIAKDQRPKKVDRWFRRLQLLSAAGYSLGHGTNDAQKGMGIITAALVAGGMMKTYHVPYWVIICCHLAMGGGTMAGGWRIIKTMGQRITKLTPFGGFAAETAGAITLMGTAHFDIPVRTTHTLLGAGIFHRAGGACDAAHPAIVWAWVYTQRLLIAGIHMSRARSFRRRNLRSEICRVNAIRKLGMIFYKFAFSMTDLHPPKSRLLIRGTIRKKSF